MTTAALHTLHRPDPETLCYYGLSLIPTQDVTSAIDPEIMRLVGPRLREGDDAIVAGGGSGSVSALIAARIGAAHVTTYEPNPTLVALMQANIAVYGETLQVIAAALAPETGQAPFALRSGESWSGSHLDATGSVPVPTVAIVEALADREATVLVLDVEGAEYDLIPHTWSMPLRVVVIELHGSPAQDADLTRLLLRDGYNVSITSERMRFLVAERTIA